MAFSFQLPRVLDGDGGEIYVVVSLYFPLFQSHLLLNLKVVVATSWTRITNPFIYQLSVTLEVSYITLSHSSIILSLLRLREGGWLKFEEGTS